MHWGEMDILRMLVAILCVGSFSLFVVAYFIKRIKEIWDDNFAPKKPDGSVPP